MGVCLDNALVVQSDCSLLLEIHSSRAEEAREAIAPFAELVKSPEHVHTYRLTPLSIWNARAAGLAADEMVTALHEHARYPVPENVDQTVLDLAKRFGRGGSGVIVLPCGAGKTIVGLATMEMVGQTTLVLTTSLTSVKQWRREICDKTSLQPDEIAEYTGEQKRTGPVTLTTYQILTWRSDRESEFPHLALFRARPWGLIIYDEVHLLPAPVFRATADLQARRRLGLTATLVREDNREGDVFALIGPKRFDVPWRDLERQNWIATATCVEERIPMTQERRMEYALANRRAQFRIAAENPAKIDRLRQLLEQHEEGRVLVIGEYIAQVEAIAKELGAPLVTGKTPQTERERIYDRFRRGELHCIVLSKVGNFAIDLPDADLLIQVSGMFGSRQEEAQRLGRILRPKADGRAASFFTLVSRDTRKEEFAHHRKLFLTEQGYSYRVIIADQP